LLFLEYSGGLKELDKSLAMFPSFDFDAVLKYLKIVRKPWLYSRLGFLLAAAPTNYSFVVPCETNFCTNCDPASPISAASVA